MLTWFLVTAIISFGCTAIIRRIALRYGVVDVPDAERKIHAGSVPLLGGVAVYAAFAIVLLVAAMVTGKIIGVISWTMLLGVLAGGLALMVGGFLDDKYTLSPKKQFIFPLLAALIAVIAGIGVSKLSNPLGGFIVLTAPLSGLVVFPWLVGTSYATKLFDGLDGLVSGITTIGCLLILALSLTAKYHQPDVALIAIIAAGAFAGFLPWNFHPAKIFLGEGGALFAGYLLGVLAVISGAKFAVALLALGLAIVDAAWVIVRRVFFEKHSPAIGDRKHLHHRLLDAGLSQRAAVLLLWIVSASFGAATLLLQSFGKLLALAFLAITTFLLGGLAILKKRNFKKF